MSLAASIRTRHSLRKTESISLGLKHPKIAATSSKMGNLCPDTSLYLYSVSFALPIPEKFQWTWIASGGASEVV